MGSLTTNKFFWNFSSLNKNQTYLNSNSIYHFLLWSTYLHTRRKWWSQNTVGILIEPWSNYIYVKINKWNFTLAVCFNPYNWFTRRHLLFSKTLLIRISLKKILNIIMKKNKLTNLKWRSSLLSLDEIVEKTLDFK